MCDALWWVVVGHSLHWHGCAASGRGLIPNSEGPETGIEKNVNLVELHICQKRNRRAAAAILDCSETDESVDVDVHVYTCVCVRARQMLLVLVDLPTAPAFTPYFLVAA